MIMACSMLKKPDYYVMIASNLHTPRWDACEIMIAALLSPGMGHTYRHSEGWYNTLSLQTCTTGRFSWICIYACSYMCVETSI